MPQFTDCCLGGKDQGLGAGTTEHECNCVQSKQIRVLQDIEAMHRIHGLRGR